jgi:hypothetical protein
MPERLQAAFIVALTLGGLGLTYVAAQEAEAPPADDEAEAPSEEALPLATSPEEQLAQAEAIYASGVEIRDQVQGLLGEARRDGDAMRITCLEDKLTQIRAHLANDEERTEALRAAITAGDEEARAHQYTVVRVLAQKLRGLARDAAQCVGQNAFEIPEGVLDSEHPLEPEDPTVLPQTPAPDVPFIPPPASGFS